MALELARSGYARIAVISLGGNHAHCLPAPPKVEVICFHPDPLNTRGEAEAVARLIAQRHWKRIILVPERSQATRARLLFKRCTNADLVVVPVADPFSQLFIDVVYEWGALTKALVFKTSC